MDKYLVTNSIVDKIQWKETTRGSWSKEKFKPTFTTEKQKIAPPLIKGTEIKPRLGQGRAGIKCKITPSYSTY